MINLFHYIERTSPIHRMTGASKFVCLVLWTLAAMGTYDTRFLFVLFILSIVLFKVSKIRIKDVSFMLGFTAVFMILNNILVFAFSPEHGTEIYGTFHEITRIGNFFVVTKEQLFYHLNLVLKYLATIPIVLLFISTTNPSEFAASLNRLGIPYSVSYSVALALRYIPDVQREYHDISQAQQARGIEMSKKENLFKRLKKSAAVLIPLILSSMDRIEMISNAMELRGFGKKKKRTWYMSRPFLKTDIVSMILCAGLVIIAVFLGIINKGRFYNPFIK